ncbi:MAG TPA: NAD(P)-binding domain-containing protein [Microbacteriaceae bacterium]|nr:NAD(P)-binding domain-containing protein [Microbacteriaceae bacterium]
MTERSITAVIVGAGHSGLAMSARLTARGVDHVIFERGEIAQSWRSERWDSLHLLTPNWQTGLPGYDYDGTDPDGYLSMPEVVSRISSYAQIIDAPVRAHTAVTKVTPTDEGYRVETDDGVWQARHVIVASGTARRPNLPAAAAAIPAEVRQITPLSYRNPDQLGAGGVLVVGASASGAQLADEIARSGRRVVVSSGELVRMPRVYRGRDVFWWMDRAGVLDERYDEMDDIVRARHVPSPQLVGSKARRDLDLGTLQELGVEIVGKLGMVRDGTALFSGGLANVARLADLKEERLLDRFDEWAKEHGDITEAPYRPDPVTVPARPRLSLDLVREGIETVVWATGFAPDYSWLDVDTFDRKGRIVHDGGVGRAHGLYTLGTSLLRRRRSTYLSGAAADTEDLARHLVSALALAH